MENRKEVISSLFKLTRAMRRKPHREDHAFPFPVERMLSVLEKNDGATSRELCEILDVRPSSLSELIGKMEELGLVTRRASEEDKRAAQVLLTDGGREAASAIRESMDKRAAEFSACFTDEEAAQFCLLADKLSAHLESLTPEEDRPHGRCGRGRHEKACGGPHGPFRHHHRPFGRPF